MIGLFRSAVAMLALLTIAIAPSKAQAFEAAYLEIIGFSKDGSRFAFEEYGSQDGSGFAYSNIYVIDTKRDKWADGSPFRVLLEDVDESATDIFVDINRARARSKAMAKAALANITVKGRIAASNAISEVSAKPHTVTFVSEHTPRPIYNPIKLDIDLLKLPAGERCYDLGESMGFRLNMTIGKDKPVTKVLHQDKKLPKSRGCPFDYKFSNIILFPGDQNSNLMVVLLAYTRLGFEGADLRYLAYPFPLDLPGR
ncbi:MAG: DUF2259 domain-containing protein [Pseudomonadota bacterium]